MKTEEMKRMSRAFVLVDVAKGKERNVMDDLLQHEEVIEAHMIPGKHDILAVLQIKREIIAPSHDKLMDILDRIRGTSGVLDTETIEPTFSKTKLEEAHRTIT